MGQVVFALIKYGLYVVDTFENLYKVKLEISLGHFSL